MNNLTQKLKNAQLDQVNAICDEYFSFDISAVEKTLAHDSKSDETYAGSNLDESALNTSWADYYSMIKLLSKNKLKMLDIGSAYSKGTLLSKALGARNISSVELVAPRVRATKSKLSELNLKLDEVYNADALNISFEEYDIFFIYQPVSKFLSDLLSKISNEQSKKIWVIESHGDLVNRIDLDSRFNNKFELIELNSKRHLPFLYQYDVKSSECCEMIENEINFYQSEKVLIETEIINFGKIKWLSTLENSFIDYIEGIQTISINNRRINSNNTIDRILKFNPTLSAQNEMRIKQNNFKYNGKYQKILKCIIEPKDYLELSIDGIISTK